MRLLDLTLEAPAENLALDEALLDEAEQSPEVCETLRLWESPRPLVVLGRSSQVEFEVNREFCRQQEIPILRRASGGATIVAGPGSLMYAVVLSYETRPALRSLDEAHRAVLDTLLAALRPLAPGVQRRGTSDLALGDLKFSGNSLRCKRRYFLYHGTLLYDFPLELVEQCLLMPPRQPSYREQRSHRSFLTNLAVDGSQLRAALVNAWQANEVRRDWPQERVAEIVERYTDRSWRES